jgi:hypothetical protein
VAVAKGETNGTTGRLVLPRVPFLYAKAGNQPEERKERTVAQAKMPFVVRETADWLLSRQDWISDGARHLYLTLRTLADHKTGELRIPGKNWIKLRTIEKKAGISHNTRKKYMRELIVLNAIRVDREYVDRKIDGRELKVLGESQVTLLQLKNPHLPTNPGNQKTESPPAAQVPPTDQSKKPHEQAAGPTDQYPENGHLPTNSPTVQGLVDQFLSEQQHLGGPEPPVGVADQNGLERAIPRRRQESPALKDDDDSARLRNIHPDLRRWITTRILLRARSSGTEVRSTHAYVHAALPEFLDNLSVEVEDYLIEQAETFYRLSLNKNPSGVRAGDVWRHLASSVNHFHLPADEAMVIRAQRSAAELLELVTKEPDPPPQARQPEPKPEESKIHPNAALNLRRHAFERGMNAATLRAYVWKTFRVTSPGHLTVDQYHHCMDYVVRLPKVQ